MFRLLHFFLLTSTAGLMALGILLWYVHGHAVQQLVEYAEVQNVTLARSFANTIWPRFSTYIVSVSELPAATLRERQEVREIQGAVKAASAGLPILKVKIYNLNGLTVFSSDPAEIGQDKSGNQGFIRAAKKGLPTSALTYRNRLNSFEGTVQNRDIVESYLPINGTDGGTLGVFELYSDVTPLLNRVNQSSNQLMFGLLFIFGALYAVLFLLVRRADRTIKRQYTNIAEKNEALEKARNTLELRVAERTRKLTDEIAERERAEENLHKLSQAVEQSPAMTIITDPAGNIEYVNSRFVAVTGYTLEEVSGKNPNVLKAGEVPPDIYKELWKAISVGKEWRGEFHNRKKNGDLYWARTTISPVMGGDGAVTHFLGISEDTTALKIAEQEKRQQQSELAHAGRVITLGEMATSLAHELNQPLSIISGCAQMCKKALRSGNGATEALQDPVEQVLEQAERANEIIHSIRGFVKKDTLKKEDIDINDGIYKISDLLRSDARDHSVSVSFDFARDFPPVSANMLQIQQVILNLAHNGIEAMMESKSNARHLTIKTAILPDKMVGISVHDTGSGIQSEQLEQIFAPFYTSKPDGLGMGLSISHSIVEAHGGKLWATSNEREGTYFHISLPAAHISEPRENPDDA
jgi:PAS domain S-box-containing protein